MVINNNNTASSDLKLRYWIKYIAYVRAKGSEYGQFTDNK